MGNSSCCFVTSSSMEYWDGEDWEFLKTETKKKPRKSCSSSSRKNKVFDEGSVEKENHHQVSIEKLRTSCDGNGKVTLKISKGELVELLEAIQQNNNTQQQSQTQQWKQLASAEQVLLRLIKARSDHEVSNKNHCSSNWKPVLETIHE